MDFESLHSKWVQLPKLSQPSFTSSRIPEKKPKPESSVVSSSSQEPQRVSKAVERYNTGGEVPKSNRRNAESLETQIRQRFDRIIERYDSEVTKPGGRSSTKPVVMSGEKRQDP